LTPEEQLSGCCFVGAAHAAPFVILPLAPATFLLELVTVLYYNASGTTDDHSRAHPARVDQQFYSE